jgi:hypothetical protein
MKLWYRNRYNQIEYYDLLMSERQIVCIALRLYILKGIGRIYIKMCIVYQKRNISEYKSRGTKPFTVMSVSGVKLLLIF